MPLILASGSPYRRQLLERLGLAFECHSPDVDERPQASEAPDALARRLAERKARALAPLYPDSLIIGSDQVAALDDGRPLGKPGSPERARSQLRAARGRWQTFYTGLCLLDTGRDTAHTLCETFKVKFLPLTDAQIDAYIAREQPLDCAGSFKAEGLGIALFERMEGRDPSTLIGLPLIALVELLRQAGIDPLLAP
ncbi:Maf family protein [Marinimicrobium alkaliphilum]|uniref:Maf family protein n=1 Tax=Marinimicrobium alkaliphilum TaxID=2202654 RepID=UPI002FCD2CB0